ncbi:phosphotransferase [Alkalihalobacillus sp. AL-G]|uniref:phosphotransferase n=1 Tax=Alkalihalobacillus sp. AL-G TaxID=2926399 RepID=UPI00272B5839|nr:phosphotransferase [Alkalihalobacillus sp. AL-G]WLD92556.1 aminoglycoside phosphotransferase family protein [Alkalihalobacillus sp. AL-G]
MLEKIIDDLVKNQILPDSISHWNELKGGTESTVGVIGTNAEPNMYILKSNNPQRIAEEVRFYQTYKLLQLLPNIQFVDPAYRFFIYDYVPGETNYCSGSKQALMYDLITHFVQHYVQPECLEEYEWVEDPKHVDEDLSYSKSVIGSYLKDEDHLLVKDTHLYRRKRLKNEQLYVLHGDFGVHNFLFDQRKLTGIIDPIPVVGRKMYDILYAFCSSPDDLEFSILLNIVEQLKGTSFHENEIAEDMILALYFRVATCIKHHPNDLKQYLHAWKVWKQLLKDGGGVR